MTDALPERAKQLLATKWPAVLTTLNHDGTPHSTPVWAMSDGDEVVMSTLTKRVKYHNVARDPRVSVVLVNPEDPLQYMSLNGSVRLVPDEERTVLNALSMKYLGTPYPLDEGPEKVRITLRLRPERVIGQTEAAQ